MKPVIQQKAQDVELIAGKLKASQTTVVVDYRGLTVKEATELRKQLREAGVEFKVYKNNLVRRAAQEVGMEGLVESLTGPNAIATCAEDAIAPAKVIYEFAKTCPALEIKGGVMDGVVVTAEEITVLATLPNRDGMLSMLLSVLQAPMRNMALAVKAVAEQKEA